MPEFPIEEIYKKVAKFDVVDRGTTVSSGVGFFYWYKDNAYFVTKRDYVVIEEKAFLPDSITLYLDTDYGFDKTMISLPLYNNIEIPVWRVILTEQNETIISIPIPKSIVSLDLTQCFLSLSSLPSQVYLQVDDTSLNISVSTCVLLANYFFYSNSSNEKALQKRIEENEEYRINRKGFARDMVEMVLVLIQNNLDKMKDAEYMKKTSQKEITDYLSIHNNLTSKLEDIMMQFSDVLEPSIFDRIQNIFAILKDGNLEDYLIARHLIRKVLALLGQNILFVQ